MFGVTDNISLSNIGSIKTKTLTIIKTTSEPLIAPKTAPKNPFNPLKTVFLNNLPIILATNLTKINRIIIKTISTNNLIDETTIGFTTLSATASAPFLTLFEVFSE